jgi:hypothetical protein
MGLVGRRWSAEIWRLPATRCSGEAWGSKSAEWWIEFGAVERRGITRDACPRWRGSAVGEEGQQVRVGVAGGVRMVGEEVLGGTKLEVGSRGSQGSRRDLSIVAQ